MRIVKHDNGAQVTFDIVGETGWVIVGDAAVVRGPDAATDQLASVKWQDLGPQHKLEVVHLFAQILVLAAWEAHQMNRKAGVE